VIRPRRAAVAVLALLITTAGAGTAWAKPQAQGQNTREQLVQGGDYRVVIKAGTTPATGPEAPPPVYSLASVVDLTMTNIGTVTPGSVQIVAGGGLSLVAGIVICRVQFTTANPTSCPAGKQVSFDATGVVQPPLPAAKEVWYVKAGGVLALGATLSAQSTPPAKQTVSS
jgi:hypothetical protein